MPAVTQKTMDTALAGRYQEGTLHIPPCLVVRATRSTLASPPFFLFSARPAKDPPFVQNPLPHPIPPASTAVSFGGSVFLIQKQGSPSDLSLALLFAEGTSKRRVFFELFCEKLWTHGKKLQYSGDCTTVATQPRQLHYSNNLSKKKKIQ